MMHSRIDSLIDFFLLSDFTTSRSLVVWDKAVASAGRTVLALFSTSSISVSPRSLPEGEAGRASRDLFALLITGHLLLFCLWSSASCSAEELKLDVLFIYHSESLPLIMYHAGSSAMLSIWKIIIIISLYEISSLCVFRLLGFWWL